MKPELKPSTLGTVGCIFRVWKILRVLRHFSSACSSGNRFIWGGGDDSHSTPPNSSHSVSSTHPPPPASGGLTRSSPHCAESLHERPTGLFTALPQACSLEKAAQLPVPTCPWAAPPRGRILGECKGVWSVTPLIKMNYLHSQIPPMSYFSYPPSGVGFSPHGSLRVNLATERTTRGTAGAITPRKCRYEEQKK